MLRNWEISQANILTIKETRKRRWAAINKWPLDCRFGELRRWMGSRGVSKHLVASSKIVGPSWTLCPLALPNKAIALEAQIEPWLAFNQSLFAWLYLWNSSTHWRHIMEWSFYWSAGWINIIVPLPKARLSAFQFPHSVVGLAVKNSLLTAGLGDFFSWHSLS